MEPINPSYVIDELYSLTDEEVSQCFGKNMSPDSVITEYTIPAIEQKLSEFACKTNKTNAADNIKQTNELDEILRNATEYTPEEIQNFTTTDILLKGEIIWHDPDLNRGLILIRRNGYIKKAWYSNISWKLRKTLRAGDYVTFNLNCTDNNNVIACNLNITGHAAVKSQAIMIDPDVCFGSANVLRYGINNGYKKLRREKGITYQDLKEHGYTMDDLYYVYVKTPRREFKIFKESSKIIGDGHVPDFNTLLKQLDKDILGITDVDKWNPKESKQNTMETQNRKRWIQYRLKAELYRLGYSKQDQKKILTGKSYSQFVKACIIDPDAKSFHETAILLSTGNKPSMTPQNGNNLWFKNMVKAEMTLNGYTNQEIKDMLLKDRLSDKIDQELIDIHNEAPSIYAHVLMENQTKETDIK